MNGVSENTNIGAEKDGGAYSSRAPKRRSNVAPRNKNEKDKTATAFGADPFFTILIACSARCADR